MRQVEIAFPFPLKAQAKEFEGKLNLPDYDALLADHSKEKDKEGQELSSFRFLGVNVKRQVLDASGNVLQDWTPIDVDAAFRPLAWRNNKTWEDESAEVKAIEVPRLAMPRLKASEPGQYPKIEQFLPKIKDTMKAMAGKNGAGTSR